MACSQTFPVERIPHLATTPQLMMPPLAESGMSISQA